MPLLTEQPDVQPVDEPEEQPEEEPVQEEEQTPAPEQNASAIPTLSSGLQGRYRIVGSIHVLA